MKTNAFGQEIPEPAEILQDPELEAVIKGTLKEIFEYFELNNPDGAESAFKKTTDGQGQAITCGIWDNKPWSTPVGKSDKSTFYLPLGDTSCAEVTVDKLTTNKTTITSRGYNMSFDGTKCGTDSARRVERAIKLTLTVN